jgi:S1-C subfamily serine protease
VEKLLAPSLVQVTCHLPYGVGVSGDAFIGSGVIIDAEKGLVLVDRMTAPTALGDFSINFFDSIQVAGKVVAIHPIRNLAVVQYDPALIGDTPVKACTFASEQPARCSDLAGIVAALKGSKHERTSGVGLAASTCVIQ